MFDFRWAVQPGTSTKAPVLQFRVRHETGPANALGRAWEWGPWQDVRTEVVKTPPLPRETP